MRSRGITTSPPPTPLEKQTRTASHRSGTMPQRCQQLRAHPGDPGGLPTPLQPTSPRGPAAPSAAASSGDFPAAKPVGGRPRSAAACRHPCAVNQAEEQEQEEEEKGKRGGGGGGGGFSPPRSGPGRPPCAPSGPGAAPPGAAPAAARAFVCKWRRGAGYSRSNSCHIICTSCKQPSHSPPPASPSPPLLPSPHS